MISALLLTAGALSATGAMAAPAPSPAMDGIRIPLHKSDVYLSIRSKPTVDSNWLLAQRERTRTKFGSSSTARKAGAKRATGSEALSDQTSLWMGPVTIGGQVFQIDFDTGSSDLWVPNASCKTGGCVGHKKYTVSSTAKKQSGSFSISYGDGSTSSGPIYTDTVSVGGIQVTGQLFSPVTAMAGSFSSSPSDGLAGMAFPALSQLGGNPFFQTMVAQGKVTASVFSFRLATSGSELFLGGTNSAHYSGAITYTPVTQAQYWTVSLGGISVNGSPVGISSKTAIIDSGTTLAYGSTADVAAVWAKVPGSGDATDILGSDYAGFYVFPCSSTATISLVFGGKAFPFTSAGLNLGSVTTGSSQCVGALVGDDSLGLGSWLVGDAWMQGVYNVFDVGNKRVGFATAR